MKRLACLLTVLLVLLSATALGEEAYSMNLSFTLDAEQTEAYLTGTANGLIPGARIETLTAGMSKLLNDLQLRAIIQDEVMTMAALVRNEVLFDLVMESDEERMIVGYPTSMKDAALLFVGDPEEERLFQQGMEELNTLDWSAVLADMRAVLAEWGAPLAKPTELGVFVGDAYEDGFLRATMTFDDSELSALLERLLDCIGRRISLEGAKGLRLPDSGTGMLCQWVKDVGEANRRSYVLHHVVDMQRMQTVMSGFSLTVLEQDQPVMTLSLGERDDVARLVWGFGAADANRYLEMVATELTDTQLNVTAALYNDPLRQGFRAVRGQGESSVVLRAESAVNLSTTADTLTVNSVTSVLQPALHETRLRCEFDGSSTETTADMVWRAYADDSDTPCLTMRFTVEPCEPVAFDWSGKTLINADDEQANEEAFNEMMQDIALRVFRLLPAELWSFIM